MRISSPANTFCYGCLTPWKDYYGMVALEGVPERPDDVNPSRRLIQLEAFAGRARPYLELD